MMQIYGKGVRRYGHGLRGESTKKPCYPHGLQGFAKVKFANGTFSQIMLCVFVSLHVIVAHVADQAQLVVFHILYHHIFAMKLLDDDFTIISIWVHAADIVV